MDGVKIGGLYRGVMHVTEALQVGIGLHFKLCNMYSTYSEMFLCGVATWLTVQAR